MISKLKKLLKLNRNTQIINVQGITSKFSDGLFSIMDKTFAQKQNDNSVGPLSPAETQKMIKGYAKKNMILAATSSIVPGPLGILTSIPQLVISFGNQMKMVYDIGGANGKENILTKDLLLDIPFAALGGDLDLGSIQQANNLSNSNTNMLYDKAIKLSKNVVQQTLKKSVVQFVPVAGPVMMGVWARMSTQKISKSASDFFSPDLIASNNIIPTTKIAVNEQELQLERIKLLCNIVECNDEVNELELESLASIIANSSIPEKEQSDYLGEALLDNKLFEVNYDLLRTNGESHDAIMEMIVMASRDGEFDNDELNYVYEVGGKLQVAKSDIDELISTSNTILSN